MSSTLTPTSPVPTTQRIEELARIIMAYSEVTEKLQQSHDQLTQTVQTLRQELSEKNRELERRNRLAALGEMAAGMAHEIRNPLGGIQLYASLLSSDVSDRPASQQLVTKISAGVKRLEALVSQVLQFTREIHVNIAPMDLADAIETAVELCAPRAAAKRVNVSATGPKPMAINADPLLLGQTIMNLLLNAIEAAPDGGAVSLDYSMPVDGGESTQFHLVVRDNGPGIPTHILDRIFNPFFTTKDSGTGLGLAIVHRVIEAHNGTIRAGNNPDGGAKFEIRI